MSRASIVGMLVAAEIAIVGIALYVLAPARATGWHALHADAASAAPIAAIDAGNAPRIAVDDVESRIVVVRSGDGRVHVKDLSSASGIFSDRSSTPLVVKRTTDGVSIARPGSTGFSLNFVIGSFDRRVEVDVPTGSHVEIARCAGADVSGIAGGVTVRSQDGHVTLADLQGNVTGDSDNGWISATRVHGESLALHSSDGHLTLADVAVDSLNARTADGKIEAHDIAVAGSSPHALLHSDDGSIRLDGSFAAGGSYEVSTDDGSVRAGFAPGADLTVNASTADGKVIVDGSPFESSDGSSVQHTVKLGSGSGNLRLSSNSGSIHILTNGAV